MNTKDLIRLGVPVGEPIQLAYEFIQNFITPDGRRAVLAASFDSTPLLVWDLEERPKRSYARRPQRSVTAVAITPDGRTRCRRPGTTRCGFGTWRAEKNLLY